MDYIVFHWLCVCRKDLSRGMLSFGDAGLVVQW